LSEETRTTDTEELRREIAEAREELGDTVEALARKADVKAQTKAKVAAKQDEIKAKVGAVREKVGGATPEQARDTATHLTERARERPVPVTAVGALLAGVAIGWLIARR
jgi:transposase-like protein